MTLAVLGAASAGLVAAAPGSADAGDAFRFMDADKACQSQWAGAYPTAVPSRSENWSLWCGSAAAITNVHLDYTPVCRAQWQDQSLWAEVVAAGRGRIPLVTCHKP